MADIDDNEKKDGQELFKELFRLLPSVEVEDYYKMGRWQDADIQLDIDLIVAHRKEAGAPEPPELEDLELPQLPSNGGAGMGMRMGMGMGSAYGAGAFPAGPRPVTPGIAGIKPAATKPLISAPKPAGLIPSLKPQPPKAAPSAAAVAAAVKDGAQGGPSAELRQIALFIAKWKLEATKTKLLLARLTPTRRRHVMTKFTVSSSGGAPTAQLEQFIGQCERTNSWSSADSAEPSAPTASGLKRPLGGSLQSEPKRQKIVPTAGPASTSRPLVPASRISASKPGGVYGAPAAKPLAAKPPSGKPPSAVRSAYTPAKPAGPKITSTAPRPPTTSPYKPKAPMGKPAGPKPTGPKPAGAKIGTIKPGAPKAGGGAKPGSLIKNLLNL